MTVKKEDKTEENKSQKVEDLFSKQQLLSAERFRNRKDIVNALLSHDKQYTIEDVERMISKYMKGQVR